MSGLRGGQIRDSTGRGIRAIKVSLSMLAATAILQAVVVFVSGSVGLLADTLHNLGDAFTGVPLWMAFRLARRHSTARFSYGYHRAEDAAGLLILLVIVASAVGAGYASVQGLMDPAPLRFPILAMVAATFGITALLMNVSERKREARQTHFELVKLTEDTVDPAEWGPFDEAMEQAHVE